MLKILKNISVDRRLIKLFKSTGLEYKIINIGLGYEVVREEYVFSMITNPNGNIRFMNILSGMDFIKPIDELNSDWLRLLILGCDLRKIKKNIFNDPQ